jgi:transposase
MKDQALYEVLLPGYLVEGFQYDEQGLLLTARAIKSEAPCPSCSQVSNRVHSYYTRSPLDLALAGPCLHLCLVVRRFRCMNPKRRDHPLCPRKTFAEPMTDLVGRYARRTTRLAQAQSTLGLAMGGKAGQRLLHRLCMPTSADMLLRLVRQAAFPQFDTPRVLGVDDWAKRKGRVYGTILTDLERHRVVGLLPDRTSETLATWLRDHPGVDGLRISPQ